MKKNNLSKIVILLLCLYSAFVIAQNPGDIDPSFAIGNSLKKNGIIRAVATQSDGKIIVGGDFFEINGIQTKSLARLNSDGTLDSSFLSGNGFNINNGAVPTVYSIAIQSDGKIIVGGYFTSYNNQTANYIIRLNSDGTVDSNFNVSGSGFNTIVKSILLLNDNKIMVCGSFSSFNSVTTDNIIRLNSDGTIDNDFATTGTGFNGEINTMVIHNDGNLIVGGNFTSYNNVNANRILKLNPNGSRNNTMFFGNGFNLSVNSISLSGSKLVVGGNFNTYNGQNLRGLVRLNSDGQRDFSFNVGTGFDDYIFSTAVQSDNKVLVGGRFANYKGVFQNKLSRLNSDGSIDTTFDIGGGLNGTVNIVSLQSDGKIIYGGEFNFYKETSNSCIIKLENNGEIDSTFNADIFVNNGRLATAIAKQSDGKIICVGEFRSSFDDAVGNIVRLNADGTKDNTFNTGSGFNYHTEAVAIQTDGKIIVCGAFNSFNGIAVKSILRLNSDGSLDNSFNYGTSISGVIYSCAVQLDEKIIVAGAFTNYNGYIKNFIVRLEPNGIVDPTFNISGTGFSGSGIRDVKIQSDGKIIAVGIFNSYNGVSSPNVVKINSDGTIDTTFNAFFGYSGDTLTTDIHSSATLSNNKVMLGVAPYTNQQRRGILLLNEDGTVDTSFNSGYGFDETVLDLLVQPDGKIIAVGYFTSYNSETYNGVIRLNPDSTIDESFTIGSGFNNAPTSVLYDNESIILGGLFTNYNGSFASGIIKLDASNSLQTSNFIKNKLIISPNPVSTFLNINFSSSNINTLKSIKIVDINGRTVLNPDIHQIQINVEHLNSGFYILKLIYDNKELTTKFIKE